MQSITPFLWFDDNLGEAIDFYKSVFKDVKVTSISRQGDGGPVQYAEFEINGQRFMAMNAGPQYKFTEAISFFVSCETQQEIDYFWNRLSEGGEKSRCGWLKDKFGLSWQIVPTVLGDLLGDPDPAKSASVMTAMLKMDKLDIAALQQARDQA